MGSLPPRVGLPVSKGWQDSRAERCHREGAEGRLPLPTGAGGPHPALGAVAGGHPTLQPSGCWPLPTQPLGTPPVGTATRAGSSSPWGPTEVDGQVWRKPPKLSISWPPNCWVPTSNRTQLHWQPHDPTACWRQTSYPFQSRDLSLLEEMAGAGSYLCLSPNPKPHCLWPQVSTFSPGSGEPSRPHARPHPSALEQALLLLPIRPRIPSQKTWKHPCSTVTIAMLLKC